MRTENHLESPKSHHHGKESEGRRGRGRGRREGENRPGRTEGAKTFRRARALSFLERLEVKRDALKKQLETTELQTLHPTIVGELKAVEMIMAEYIQVFELYEIIEDQSNEDEQQKNSINAKL